MFQAGDRVKLVAPFRCDGDDVELDEGFDIALREHFDGAEATGEVWEVSETRRLWVHFDNFDTKLWVNPDILAPELTEREVRDAIRSILGNPNTCPKCRHAFHLEPCLNMASDNDCGSDCQSSI